MSNPPSAAFAAADQEIKELIVLRRTSQRRPANIPSYTDRLVRLSGSSLKQEEARGRGLRLGRGH